MMGKSSPHCAIYTVFINSNEGWEQINVQVFFGYKIGRVIIPSLSLSLSLSQGK